MFWSLSVASLPSFVEFTANLYERQVAIFGQFSTAEITQIPKCVSTNVYDYEIFKYFATIWNERDFWFLFTSLNIWQHLYILI